MVRGRLKQINIRHVQPAVLRVGRLARRVGRPQAAAPGGRVHGHHHRDGLRTGGRAGLRHAHASRVAGAARARTVVFHAVWEALQRVGLHRLAPHCIRQTRG